MDMGCLSRRRGELMGVAILIIVLFHIGLPRGSAWFGLCRLGNVGVDVFLFLSGMGLWFARQKSQSLRHYFARRYLRVYPTWLFVAAVFYLWQYPSRRFSQSVADLCGDIFLNWDFWLHDELTFWYVPAIMALYTVAPLPLWAIRRDGAWRWLPLLAVLWCVAVEWVTPLHEAVGHIEIFWSRVPIFLIGISLGAWVEQRRRLSRHAVGLMAVAFVASAALSWWLEQYRHGQFPLFAERMVYIPMTVAGCTLLALLLDKSPRWMAATLAFVGGMSLEIYLIHSNFFLVWLRQLHLGYWGTALSTLALSLPAAWLLKRARAVLG